MKKQYTNRFNLPEALVNALTHDDYDSGGSYVTASGIALPPRIRILRREFSDQMIEDVAERLWILFGKSAHKVIELAKSNDIREQRVYAEISGVKVSAQLDNLYLSLAKSILSDYKLTSVYAVKDDEAKPEWEAQLNTTAYLLLLSEYKVHDNMRLEIVAMLRDWRFGESLKGRYPATQVKVVEVINWGWGKQQQYIIDRIALFKEAESRFEVDGTLPDCTPDERWAQPTKYAVMKKGNKQACRGGVKDTRPEAEAFIRGHKDEAKLWIEKRPGSFTRCERYCDCLPFCDQSANVYEAVQQDPQSRWYNGS